MKQDSTERLDELREQVEEQEQELHVAIEELQDVARRTFDVRRRIRERPLLWLAGAFAVGAWLGTMWPTHRGGARG
jgi:hypothetical protein